LTTLFVGNLSPEATDGDLRTVFSVFGEIGSIKVARNRAGRRRGYAYVELEDEAFLGVDSDAVSGEFSSVVEQSDPVAELDAQLSPAVYYPGTIVAGYL
jgi:hypothetical protein